MKQKAPQTFSRFFTRYIVHSLVVCLILFICFGALSFAMEYQSQWETVETNLNYTLNYLNSFFDTVAYNSYLLSGNSTVNSVMHSPLTVDPYSYLVTMRQCEQVQSQTSTMGCRSVYLYQEWSNIVFATGTGKLDVEDFRDGEFLKELKMYPTPAIIARQQDGSRLVTLVTQYFSSYGEKSGYLCFNLSHEYLQRQMSMQLGEGYVISLETPGMEEGVVLLGDADDHSFTADKMLNSYNLKASLSFSKSVFMKRFLTGYLRSGGLLFLLVMTVIAVLGLAVHSLQELFYPIQKKLNDIYQRGKHSRSLNIEDLRQGYTRLIDDRNTFDRKLQEARRAMAEAGLGSILTGCARPDEMEDILPDLLAQEESGSFLVACVRLDTEHIGDKYRIFSKELLKSVFSEAGPQGLTPMVASMDQETLAVVMRYPDSIEDEVKEDIARKAAEAQNGLPNELAKELFISAVLPVRDISMIQEGYQQATTNLLYRDILVKECYTFTDMSGPKLSVLVPKPALDRIAFAVDIDRIELVEQYLREMMGREQDSGEKWDQLRCKALIITGAILNHTFMAAAPSLWNKLYEQAQKILNAMNYWDLLGEIRTFTGIISQERLSIIAESDSGSLYVHKACRYILENYKHRISISEIAKSLALNDKYLSRLFKQKTGQTILQYISDLRLKKAVYLLRETNLPISEIGMCIGFEDVRGFSRLFKKKYGITPSEYRSSEDDILKQK